MFWNLFLAHILADYPLQPTRLVLSKRHHKGLIAHAGVQLAVTSLLVLPYLREVWPAVLTLGIVHWLIDFLKMKVAQRWPQEVVIPYFLDQLIHVVTLIIAALWMNELLSPGTSLPNPDIFIFLSGLLLATYVWYVTEKVIFYKVGAYQTQLDQQYWYRMISRTVLLLSIVRIGQSFYAAAAALPYIQGEYRGRLIITDVLVATGSALFIWISFLIS